MYIGKPLGNSNMPYNGMTCSQWAKVKQQEDTTASLWKKEEGKGAECVHGGGNSGETEMCEVSTSVAQ